MCAEYRIMLISMLSFIITLIDVIIVIHELSKALYELSVTFIVLFVCTNIAEVVAHLLVFTCT